MYRYVNKEMLKILKMQMPKSEAQLLMGKNTNM